MEEISKTKWIQNKMEKGNIKSIEYLDEYEEMCDVEVEDVKCYYANGMLTHNCAQELRIVANPRK